MGWELKNQKLSGDARGEPGRSAFRRGPGRCRGKNGVGRMGSGLDFAPFYWEQAGFVAVSREWASSESSSPSGCDPRSSARHEHSPVPCTVLSMSRSAIPRRSSATPARSHRSRTSPRARACTRPSSFTRRRGSNPQPNAAVDVAVLCVRPPASIETPGALPQSGSVQLVPSDVLTLSSSSRYNPESHRRSLDRCLGRRIEPFPLGARSATPYETRR